MVASHFADIVATKCDEIKLELKSLLKLYATKLLC